MRCLLARLRERPEAGGAVNANDITVHQLRGASTIILYCRCAGALHLALPMPAEELVRAVEQFSGRHKACKKE